MKRKKTIITTLLAIFLIAATMFTLTACGGGKAGSVAGTYTSVIYGSHKTEITFTIEKDGKFSLVTVENDGFTSEETSITGVISVDENKEVTACSIDDILEAMVGRKSTFLGNILPDEEIDSTDYLELSVMSGIIEDYFKDNIVFKDNYILFEMGDNPQIFYKKDTEKLAKGTVLKFYSQKDVMELEGGLSSLLGSKKETYETDYYFVKGAFDLTTEIDKNDFIDGIAYESNVLKVTDIYGNVRKTIPEIKGISGFDLTTVGNKTGVIKYQDRDKVVEKTVTYTVVETGEDLPINQIKEAYLVGSSSSYKLNKVVYVSQDTEAYNFGWRIRTENYDYDTVYVKIDQENCTGDTKVIDIVGYDKTKTGYQLITIKFKGVELKQAIFVYSDTVNPVIEVYGSYGSEVVITAPAEGGNGEYTADFTNAKFTVKKADGTTETLTATKEDAVALVAWKDYEDGDYIDFVYKYTFNGVEYSFYYEIRVSIK